MKRRAIKLNSLQANRIEKALSFTISKVNNKAIERDMEYALNNIDIILVENIIQDCNKKFIEFVLFTFEYNTMANIFAAIMFKANTDENLTQSVIKEYHKLAYLIYEAKEY